MAQTIYAHMNKWTKKASDACFDQFYSLDNASFFKKCIYFLTTLECVANTLNVHNSFL
jgi:hypothetical protein